MVWVGEILSNPEQDSKIFVDEADYVEDEIRAPFAAREIEIRSENVDNYYDVLNEIGEGKFGTVYKCKEKTTDLNLAAKYVLIENARRRAEVEHEVNIMGRLQHPRIIQIYDAFSFGQEIILIMELVEGGELFERLVEEEFVLTESAVIMIMRQVCEGMEYIHSQNIVHLDMKPENILCLSRTGNRIKLIDFGLAQEYHPGKDLKIIVGTPEFLAPEVVSYESLSFKTDQWSIGVICYILLSGISPFLGETMAQTYGHVHKGEWSFEEEYFTDVSEAAKDFITNLILYNRDSRMSAAECLDHPWLKRKVEEDLHFSKTLNKAKLKSYLIKRRWRKAINAILALRRIAGRSISECSDNIPDLSTPTDHSGNSELFETSSDGTKESPTPPSTPALSPIMGEETNPSLSSDLHPQPEENKWDILTKADGYLSNIVLPYS